MKQTDKADLDTHIACPYCSAPLAEKRSFCPDCGAPFSDEHKHLRLAVEQEVKKAIKNDLRDGKQVERELAEAVATKVFSWTRMYSAAVGVLATLLIAIVGFLGYRKYEDFTDTIERVENVVKPKIEKAEKDAETARNKVAEVQALLDGSSKTAKQLLASASTVTSGIADMKQRMETLEKETSANLASASQKASAQVSDVDMKVSQATQELTEQRRKLADTSELVSAMFANAAVETLPMTNFSKVAITGTNERVTVYMLLGKAPIPQTVQLQWFVSVQPKSSYGVRGNLVAFRWSQNLSTLTTRPMEVSYIPNPASKDRIYKTLAIRDGKIFADEVELPPLYPSEAKAK